MPDEPMTYADIAELSGLAVATVRHYRMSGHMPEPDASNVPYRPLWHRRTIEHWLANRPGRGNYVRQK